MFVCVVSLPNFDKLILFAYVHKKNSGMPVVNYFSTFFLTNLLSKLAQFSKLGTKRLFKSTELKNCKHLVRLRASKCSPVQVYHRAQGL